MNGAALEQVDNCLFTSAEQLAIFNRLFMLFDIPFANKHQQLYLYDNCHPSHITDSVVEVNDIIITHIHLISRFVLSSPFVVQCELLEANGVM